MKALKEKRISLRSLWRRGLVILSLFALLFAVGCSDTADSNGGGGGGGDGPGTNGKPADYVTYMRVVKHPTNPSYQGAPAELYGLVVELTWNPESGKPVELYTDVTKFDIYPSTCLVPSDDYPTTTDIINGVSTTKKFTYSQPGQYTIQFTGGVSKASPVSVYIPYVTALDSPQTPKGKVGEVYQDMGYKPDIGTGKDVIAANYKAVPNTIDIPPGVWASNYKGWPKTENPDNTDQIAAGEHKINIAADDKLWTLTVVGDNPGNSYKATAKYYLGLVNNSPMQADIEITAYYYVQYLEVNGFKNKLGPFYGDQDVNNDTIDWLDYFIKAEPNLKVIYYPPPKTRDLPMWEYANALTKANPLAVTALGAPPGGGAAALIEITGGNPGGSFTDRFGNKMAVSLFADYIEDSDNQVIAKFYYYDNNITAKPGDVYATPSTKPINSSWPNFGTVNISSSGAIYVFNDFVKVKREGIPEDWHPEVMNKTYTNPSNSSTPTPKDIEQMNNMVYTLFTFWNVYQEWVSPTDPNEKMDPIYVPIGLGGAPARGKANITDANTLNKTSSGIGTPPGGYPFDIGKATYRLGLGEWPDWSGIDDFDNEAPDSGERELRTCVLYFQPPVSTGETAKDGTSIDWRDIGFEYYVKP